MKHTKCYTLNFVHLKTNSKKEKIDTFGFSAYFFFTTLVRLFSILERDFFRMSSD